jgi:hypothetical protein
VGNQSDCTCRWLIVAPHAAQVQAFQLRLLFSGSGGSVTPAPTAPNSGGVWLLIWGAAQVKPLQLRLLPPPLWWYLVGSHLDCDCRWLIMGPPLVLTWVQVFQLRLLLSGSASSEADSPTADTSSGLWLFLWGHLR